MSRSGINVVYSFLDPHPESVDILEVSGVRWLAKPRPLCVTIYSVIFACLICHPGKALIGPSRILPINLIWSDSTSSMTQSREGIFSGGGGPEMARFVELRSILLLVMLLGCPTLIFNILEARPFLCTPCLCECVQVLDKKELGCLSRLFIDTMTLALRADDIPLSKGLPFKHIISRLITKEAT